MSEIPLEQCHLHQHRSISDCRACRVEPWDRLHGGGWRPCPPRPAVAPVTVIPPISKTGGNYAIPMQGGGYTGDICASCGGARMRRAGVCLVCDDCGDTNGGCS